MTDSMQFGPEWLRNLSQQANENTMVMPKYQLAEHRYGREEMLALFDKSVFSPEPLRSISGLFVEKIQLPLALIQMSEEETRVWNSSVTTENVPRGLNKSISSNMASGNAISMSSGGNAGLSRGRGISVDRGRGRGNRGGTYHYNNRNYSEEGTDTSHPNTAFGRPRIFDRSQSHNSERNWSERNGNADYNDWNGYNNNNNNNNNNNAENGLSTSPRKDFGSTMRITSREDTNWRRRPGKDEDDSWRSSRHGRGYTNWREGGERDREKEKDVEGSEQNKDRRWMSRVVNMHSQTNRRNSENKENNLPEWATESPSEVGGSFDSSGAFHGLNSDEEEYKEKEYEKSRNEPNRSSNKKVSATSDSSHRVEHNDMKTVHDQKKNKMKEKASLINKNSIKKLKDEELSEMPECPPSLHNIENSTTVLNQRKMQSQQTSQQQLQQQLQQLQPQSSPPSQRRKEAIQNTSDDYSNVNSNKERIVDTSRSSSQQMRKPKNQDTISQPQCNLEFEAPSSSAFDSGFNAMNHRDAPSVLVLNSASYPNMTSSSNSGSNLDSKLLITPVDIVNNSISLMNQTDSIDKGSNLSTANVVSKEKEEELDGIVGDVVSKIMEDEEKVEKLKRLENMNMWFYRDPQGTVQGPFTSNEMAEWFRLGYFHDKTLMVRRASENNYYPLQKLVSIFGQSPFENVTLQNIDNYAPRLPVNVMGNAGIPHTNMTDDALLLSQPYQTPYDIQSMYARQALAANNKRQLSQAPDELKSLYEQQRLLSSHLNSGADANSAVPPTIPLVQGYMHPIIPTLPSNNHSLVLLLNQIQQQQQHQQLQQHLIQQRMQQQQQQQQQQQPQQQSHQHQHSLQSAHQPQQHQQQPQKSPQQDVKSDRVPVNLMSHLEHPLQQLMHKANNLSTSNQIPLVPPQGNNYLQSLSADALPPNTTPSVSTDDNQSSNAIHNLLKQLSMATEKQSKQVDSVWGPSNSPSVPILNSSTFNAQLWCSQVGRIGPSSSTNSGLWATDGVPTTTAMKTEQQIIESFMKDMERKQDDSRKETEAASVNRRQEEELIRKLMEESVKKKEAENKLEEEKKAKREDEKRKKRQEEEERLRKIEEEQRKKSVEDVKRREEERRRKEEEKRRKEEEKEHKRKLEEEKKKLEQKRKEAEDAQRKQTNAVRRLKEQQATATANEKSSKSATASEISGDQQPKSQKQVANTNSGNKPLLKSQSGIVEDSKKQNSDCNRAPANEDRVANKQLAKSKSTPSVPTQGQKTLESEKKEKKKKEKNAAAVSAWPDQKKITNVKSLAEIQAEEQKQLAKQIEKERNERLLQQQQAVATAQAAKEAANVNIWNSQNQPWKTNLTWTSAVSSSSSSTSNNKSELPASGKAWNEQNRVTSAAAGNSVNKNQPTTANTAASIAANKSVPGNSNAIAKSTASAKSKQKKEDPASKKTSLTLAVPKNDELSKWGVKALSNLKPSVDVPTFIAFLREVESPNDVMEYVTDYLGDGKEIKSFVKQFLEKRSVLMPAGSASVTFNTTVMSTVSGTGVSKKNKKKPDEVPSNITREPVKQPASKQNSLEFTEVKGKMKKSKKKPMLRLDSAFLGFNVTAAPDRINVGDRDYGEDLY